MSTPSPLAAVQAQLDAYNAKDVEALLLTYAPDAEQFMLHGERMAYSHHDLHARLNQTVANVTAGTQD